MEGISAISNDAPEAGVNNKLINMLSEESIIYFNSLVQKLDEKHASILTFLEYWFKSFQKSSDIPVELIISSQLIQKIEELIPLLHENTKQTVIKALLSILSYTTSEAFPENEFYISTEFTSFLFSIIQGSEDDLIRLALSILGQLVSTHDSYFQVYKNTNLEEILEPLVQSSNYVIKIGALYILTYLTEDTSYLDFIFYKTENIMELNYQIKCALCLCATKPSSIDDLVEKGLIDNCIKYISRGIGEIDFLTKTALRVVRYIAQNCGEAGILLLENSEVPNVLVENIYDLYCTENYHRSIPYLKILQLITLNRKDVINALNQEEFLDAICSIANDAEYQVSRFAACIISNLLQCNDAGIRSTLIGNGAEDALIRAISYESDPFIIYYLSGIAHHCELVGSYDMLSDAIDSLEEIASNNPDEETASLAAMLMEKIV